MYYWSFSKRLNLTCDTLDTADVWWLVKALLQWVTLDTGWWHHTNLGLCINWSGTFQQEANHGNLSKVTSRVKWSVPSLTNKPICLNRRTRSFRSISLFVCLFLCFFVSKIIRENGWTDLHEIFREGVEWPWDDLIQFWVNSEKPSDAAMCITAAGFVVLSHHSLLNLLLVNYNDDDDRSTEKQNKTRC